MSVTRNASHLACLFKSLHIEFDNQTKQLHNYNGPSLSLHGQGTNNNMHLL